MTRIDKVVLVTKQTPLQELVQRFNSVGQARFYINQSGESFAPIETFNDKYLSSLENIRRSIPQTLHYQEIDRSFLPNFVFGPNDLILTLGPDGLVVNTAKYLDQQQIVAFNPDPKTIDGVLVPFQPDDAVNVISAALAGRTKLRKLTMGQATLNNGQTLRAVNDFFIGQKTHVSSRYEISFQDRCEVQSSSGIIVSTGAGSTGWYRSIVKGATAIADSLQGRPPASHNYAWSPDLDELRFSVREPFESRATKATICSGVVSPGQPLEVVSLMPQNGVIFSDGVEEDFLPFNSGSSVKIEISAKSAWLATF